MSDEITPVEEVVAPAEESVMPVVEDVTAPVEEVAPEPVSDEPVVVPSTPVEEAVAAVVTAPSVEPELTPDCAFDDSQVQAINDAKLDPGMVRNEIGLVADGITQPATSGSKRLSFSEALTRAKAKYSK